MQDVSIGIVGLGNVGGGTMTILAENREAIARKLGFRLNVVAVCSRTLANKKIPAALGNVHATTNWREVVDNPDVHVIAELIGGTSVAREVIEAAIRKGKSVVTANKELMALAGADLWREAAAAGATLAMEASVCGGIPIHSVLREGIAGDSVETLFGILNGTSNFILTEIEREGTAFDTVLAEAQRLGYAEPDPAADIDGIDARSKLALLSALAFGAHIAPSAIHTEGIRRITPKDFHYARQLKCTIRLLCVARHVEDGLFLSVRPALVPASTIIASVRGAYNAVWVRGKFGADTFYYGHGAGPLPTGVAVVSDLMRAAREVRFARAERVSPFAHADLGSATPLPIERQVCPWYLRFRVKDRPGIIASLATILAKNAISVDAVLQLPGEDRQDLPFVITVEKTSEGSIRKALAEMASLPFMADAPLALPMESGV